MLRTARERAEVFGLLRVPLHLHDVVALRVADERVLRLAPVRPARAARERVLPALDLPDQLDLLLDARVRVLLRLDILVRGLDDLAALDFEPPALPLLLRAALARDLVAFAADRLDVRRLALVLGIRLSPSVRTWCV